MYISPSTSKAHNKIGKENYRKNHQKVTNQRKKKQVKVKLYIFLPMYFKYQGIFFSLFLPRHVRFRKQDWGKKELIQVTPR